MGSPEHTELGNARRLANAHGNTLRYLEAEDLWVSWDGVRWVRGSREAAVTAAKRVADALFDEAEARRKAGNEDDLLRKWASKSAGHYVIQATVNLARGEPPITASPDVFDRDPMALNVLNGTIDLRTGKLGPHRREDMLTQLAPHAFEPDADCVQWETLLKRILPDADLRAWMQRFVGYCLTGSVKEQALYLFTGTGANGKSTVLGVLQRLLGDYARTASPALLLRGRAGNDDPGRRYRAALRAKRLAVCVESESRDAALNESQVKTLTGQDVITGALLYKNEVEFAPTAKLVLATNHLPTIKGQDLGIWRRMVPVPFGVTIPEKDWDRDLGEKLMMEAAGILAWAVQGCLLWQKEGLGKCRAILDAAAEYRDDEDPLAEFMGLHIKPDPQGSELSRDLYETYRAWCSSNDEFAWSQKKLIAELKAAWVPEHQDRWAAWSTRATADTWDR